MEQPRSISDLRSLSVAERIRLVEELWDSIADHPERVPLPESQRDELESRLDAYEREATPGEPWNDVQDRIPKQA